MLNFNSNLTLLWHLLIFCVDHWRVLVRALGSAYRIFRNIRIFIASNHLSFKYLFGKAYRFLFKFHVLPSLIWDRIRYRAVAAQMYRNDFYQIHKKYIIKISISTKIMVLKKKILLLNYFCLAIWNILAILNPTRNLLKSLILRFYDRKNIIGTIKLTDSLRIEYFFNETKANTNLCIWLKAWWVYWNLE